MAAAVGAQNVATIVKPAPVGDKLLPYHVKLSSQVQCGNRTDTTCLTTEGWKIDVDRTARMVTLHRMDAHGRWERTEVPFENVSFIRSNETGLPPK
jgi:hypothetical protein